MMNTIRKKPPVTINALLLGVGCLWCVLVGASEAGELTTPSPTQQPAPPATERPLQAGDDILPGVEQSRPAPRWEQLTPEQKKALQPFAQRWNRMPPGKRLRWLVRVEKWASMSPQERTQVRRMIQRLKKLPPAKRRQLRKRLRAFVALSPKERQRLIKNWQRFHHLPVEKRRALRREFEKKRANQRAEPETDPVATKGTPSAEENQATITDTPEN